MVAPGSKLGGTRGSSQGEISHLTECGRVIISNRRDRRGDRSGFFLSKLDDHLSKMAAEKSKSRSFIEYSKFSFTRTAQPSWPNFTVMFHGCKTFQICSNSGHR